MYYLFIVCIYVEYVQCRLPKLEGRSVDDCALNVRERLWDVLKANWMVWPVVQVRPYKIYFLYFE